MVKLLTAIYEGRLISSAASEQLYRFLSRIYWDGEALSQIPPQVQTISKQGAVDRSRSEVVLVNAPHGTYAFCLITKNQQDITYERNNEGFVLLRKVSRAIWEHYEPEHPWKPADENTAEKWYK
jgi:beta-lactamase class A